ncbi:heme ABC exporter ATP-binding protein CcmA [Bacillus sp. V3-13]|uniref:heme ABC exporter ATP-binding protein CcmA n=1 Tax=Bacillus sp. V3-13 TaxID=2053728 RepID=UPI0015E0B760|nr:heme ABC exporter ATP-binding protein CcmA [Bacillus sp. V3-13]
MLLIENVSKVLGDKHVLRNVSLAVKKGESLSIVGPNGAGKSTFFKCIVGLLQQDSGEIILAGERIKKNSASTKRKIGFLGHESFLYNSMTPVENLHFFGKLYKVKNIAAKTEELLKTVGLYTFRDIPIRSFSRGMMQRLAIARVLLAEPDILLLDEPHTGLDQEAVSLLNQIIKKKQSEGTSVLLISHDFEQVVALSERIAVLHKGRIIAEAEKGAVHDLQQFKLWYEMTVNPL